MSNENDDLFDMLENEQLHMDAVVESEKREETGLERLLSRAFDINKVLESTKPLYEELDQLTVELRNQLGDNEVTLNGYAFKVEDNFAEKNTVFRPVGVKHFQLKIESLTERATKELKKKKK